LDEQFQQQLLLPDGSEQNFVAEIVTLFSQEGERIIGELAK
jgi:histidine-containing phosphotransfer protein